MGTTQTAYMGARLLSMPRVITVSSGRSFPASSRFLSFSDREMLQLPMVRVRVEARTFTALSTMSMSKSASSPGPSPSQNTST